MIFDNDGNICIITQENTSTKTLVHNIEQVYNTHKKRHIIVNLSSLEKILLEDIVEFLRLSNTHRRSKKSFILVSDKVDLNQIPDDICLVPTLHEAYDIIEMEDIERDLGF
jgi:hypothetical protein